MRRVLPKLADFHKRNIADHAKHERLLTYYDYQGRLHKAFERSVTWLADHRMTADYEGRNSWADAVTAFRPGALSVAEGLWGLFLGGIVAAERNVAFNLNDNSSLIDCIIGDFCCLTTDCLEVAEGAAAMKMFLDDGPGKWDEHLDRIDTNMEPYMSGLDRSAVSTEAVSLICKTSAAVYYWYTRFASADVRSRLASTYPDLKGFSLALTSACARRLLSAFRPGRFLDVVLRKNRWDTVIADMPSIYFTSNAVRALAVFFAYTEDSDNETVQSLRNEVRSVCAQARLSILDQRLVDGEHNGWPLVAEGEQRMIVEGTALAIGTLGCIRNYVSEPNADAETWERESQAVNSAFAFLSNELVKRRDIIGGLNALLKKQDAQLEEIESFLSPTLDLGHDLRFRIYGMGLNYFEAIIAYLGAYARNGRQADWTPQWDLLIELTQHVVNHTAVGDGHAGMHVIKRSRGKRFERFSSIRATVRALECFAEFGITREARTGILDVVRDELQEAAGSIVRNFVDKFQELEDLGYRVAWRKIRSDYESLPTTEQPAIEGDDAQDEVVPPGQSPREGDFEAYMRLEQALERFTKSSTSAMQTSLRRKIRESCEERKAQGEELVEYIQSAFTEAEEFHSQIHTFLLGVLRVSKPETLKRRIQERLEQHTDGKLVKMHDMDLSLLHNILGIQDSRLDTFGGRFAAVQAIVDGSQDLRR